MMLGLDTNVLVRFVTGNDPGQADLARRTGFRLLDEGYPLPGGSDRVSESPTERPRIR